MKGVKKKKARNVAIAYLEEMQVILFCPGDTTLSKFHHQHPITCQYSLGSEHLCCFHK